MSKWSLNSGGIFRPELPTSLVSLLWTLNRSHSDILCVLIHGCITSSPLVKLLGRMFFHFGFPWRLWELEPMEMISTTQKSTTKNVPISLRSTERICNSNSSIVIDYLMFLPTLLDFRCVTFWRSTSCPPLIICCVCYKYILLFLLCLAWMWLLIWSLMYPDAVSSLDDTRLMFFLYGSSSQFSWLCLLSPFPLAQSSPGHRSAGHTHA